MEVTSEVKDTAKKVKEASKKITVLKKLDADTARILQQIKDKANKKSFGRKIRDAEILTVALKQVGPELIKELQENSLSERDRLNIAHEEYQKTQGKISLDQFIGKLLKGEIKAGS